MNQTFSSARFGRLLRKYWRDNGLSLLTALGALLVILIVGATVSVYNSIPINIFDARLTFVMGISIMLWPLYTMQAASQYNVPQQAVSALMLPASLFEKWLLLWVVTGLGYAACFVCFFTVIDAVGTYSVNHREWTADELAKIKLYGQGKLTIEPFEWRFLKWSPIWATLFLFNPGTLAGTLLFRRYTIAFIAFLGLGIFAMGLYVNGHLLQTLLNEVGTSTTVPFNEVWAYKDRTTSAGRYLTLPQPIGNIIRWGVGIVAVGLLYAVTYYRLKEREV